MPVRLRVRIDRDTVSPGLRRLRQEIPRRLKISVHRAGRAVEAEMRSRAPRLTGELARRIESDIGDTFAEVGSTLPRARFLEFGTKRMRARPFVLPSLERITPRFQRDIFVELKR